MGYSFCYIFIREIKIVVDDDEDETNNVIPEKESISSSLSCLTAAVTLIDDTLAESSSSTANRIHTARQVTDRSFDHSFVAKQNRNSNCVGDKNTGSDFEQEPAHVSRSSIVVGSSSLPFSNRSLRKDLLDSSTTSDRVARMFQPLQ